MSMIAPTATDERHGAFAQVTSRTIIGVIGEAKREKGRE